MHAMVSDPGGELNTCCKPPHYSNENTEFFPEIV